MLSEPRFNLNVLFVIKLARVKLWLWVYDKVCMTPAGAVPACMASKSVSQ
jgi:hypothetical protein